MNKVILVGTLGRDPELRYTSNGTAVTTFSVATNEFYKGEKKTEWHRCVAWAKTAEACANNLQKGSRVCVDGNLQTREFEGSDGIKRKVTEIVARNVEFLSKFGNSKKDETKRDSSGSDWGNVPPDTPSDGDIPF